MNSSDEIPSVEPRPETDVVVVAPRTLWQELKTSEDWWAIYVGGFLLLTCFLIVWATLPADLSSEMAMAKEQGKEFKLVNPLKAYLSKPGAWGLAPQPAEGQAAVGFWDLVGDPRQSLVSNGKSRIPGMLGIMLVSMVLFGLGAKAIGQPFRRFSLAFLVVFLLATLSYILSEQALVSYYNLEYALWALAIGLLISNTVGTPRFVRPALMTEFYIKTGLVLLGAEVLVSRLIELGLPGIFVAWVVTPIVLVSTYIFGQKVLKIESRSLNMVISADMSVCGVSAAIATAAACKAKKEELSFAIGLSMAFTVIMMIAMPALIKVMGLSPVLGGAWLGGTIDSTGAVAAAGGMLGEVALEVAATVKMIQNILIGVTAFGVAVYWVTCVEPAEMAAAGQQQSRPGVSEIWRRFPKFVLGFVLASLVFSCLYSWVAHGPMIVDAVVKDSTRIFRGWFFCLAFVSIGLETNFRELAKFLKGGKPLALYVCGQTLNILLTLFMAWLMFEVVFKEMTARLNGGG